MIKIPENVTPLREAFTKLFSSTNPFGPSGKDGSTIKAVLYPTLPYFLTDMQFVAVKKSLHALGSRKFYISHIELDGDPFRHDETSFSRHWICDDLSYEDYLAMDVFVENAIYAVDGTWGILLSHECHGLLVSTGMFWEEFIKHYPKWKSEADDFQQMWTNSHQDRGVNIDWLEPFLRHLTFSSQNDHKSNDIF